MDEQYFAIRTLGTDAFQLALLGAATAGSIRRTYRSVSTEIQID